MSDIESIIVDAFERRAEITPRNVDTLVKDAVMTAIEHLDRGEL
ncbi:MAG: 2,3,4,5-tetrahydropyridine-2,6-dicarboxylate N-succinyltransferase, partial [Chromatiales bacterium]